MQNFIEDQFPKAIAGLHVKLDNMHRLLLAQSNNSKTVSELNFTEWDYLPSEVALSEFLECSISTARRFKKEWLIKFTQEGTKVRFYIPDVLEAADKHDRVGKYIDRWCENHPPAGSPQLPKEDPKIFIENELYPGRFMFIRVKYQRWSCTVVCSPDLWDKQSEIRELVHQVILAQNERKPFKISPL